MLSVLTRMDRSAVLASKIRSALAPCSLGAWPTPLTAHPELARAAGLTALWLKREDLAGGNKVRGLEFLMSGAAPRSVFMTIGGAGSSHCLATARAARAIDCRCALAVFPQPETDASRHVAERMTETAQLVMRASSRVTFPWTVLRTWRAAHHLGRGTPHWIPGGGPDPRAVVGHLLATLELESQLDAPPDAIVVPLGTGGTAAGIVLGVAWLGWSTRVIAARVAPRIVANGWRTRRLARTGATLLRRGRGGVHGARPAHRRAGVGQPARHRTGSDVRGEGFRRLPATNREHSTGGLLAHLPVVLIHGFPFDHLMWRHQVTAFASRRCIALDLRGAGTASAPDRPDDYSMRAYADDIIALLDSDHVDRAVFCGLSMGGYIAFELVRRFAGRIAALVLCNTKTAADSEEAKRARVALATKARQKGARAVASDMVPKLLARATREQRADIVREVTEMIARQPVTGIAGALRALRDRPDSPAPLAEIPAPTLGVAGAE